MSAFYDKLHWEHYPTNLIAGPCVWEGWDIIAPIAEKLVKRTSDLGVNFIFKCSFDKANRSSVDGFRGKGYDFASGLAGLARIKEEFGCEVITDVHESSQVRRVSKVVDMLQIPAFLCRQTDLLKACAETDLPVNIKKGQFLSPHEMGNVVKKMEHFGCYKLILTERGTTFGYNNLVVDFRSIPIMSQFNYPVCIDATHSVQMPGSDGTSTGGNRDYVNLMMRCGLAGRARVVFAEIHSDPDNAPCDGPNMLELSDLDNFLLDMKRFSNE